MNTDLIALCDYKGRFGSKDCIVPYRSGMDKLLLASKFQGFNLNIVYQNFQDINNLNNKDGVFLYTSQEDNGYKYKDYIEDVIHYLSIRGSRTIPDFKYLRANNNKVFMEFLRKELLSEEYQLQSFSYGCLEEAIEGNTIEYPIVVKAAKGASGSGVFLARDESELISCVKRVSKTRDIPKEIRDTLRCIKHKGYIKDSKYRERFILQHFIPNLTNDWKVYVFWDKLFVFYRPIFKKRIFKASGGGYDNYFYGKEARIPEGLLDYANTVRFQLDVPNISLDIAYDGERFYLLEFQCLYFGTAGILRSGHFFHKKGDEWIAVENKESVESAYAYSIAKYLSKEVTTIEES